MMTSTDLPIIVNDGTSITVQTLSNCRSLGNVLLYTVNGGGHAWPGGGSIAIGKVSQNLDLTTALGEFAKNWTNISTHAIPNVLGRRQTRN
jgi:polyhydroxybutyrate depolymerase